MNDTNLIFLIFQSRSGFPLLKKLLISNPYITSLAEPWSMLSLYIPTSIPEYNKIIIVLIFSLKSTIIEVELAEHGYIRKVRV